MDIEKNRFGVRLCKQENDKLWRLLEDEMRAHAKLKEQYARVQENFHDLAKDGFEKWFIKTQQKLSTPTRHNVN